MKRLIAALVLSIFASSCGSSSPTAPSTPPATQTRIITVSGNLAFENVNIGATADRTFTIGNSGTGTLTFTSLSCSGGTGTVGYTASPTSGTVAPGSTVNVNVHFAPTIGQFYSCVLSVVGDQTSGGAAINVSGTGINNAPIFSRSGSGDTVFDMPTSVTRIRIQADYGAFSSNFIVHIGGNHIVNELLGTSWGKTHFDGTYLTTGGVVEITNSSGVSWSFVEVR